MMYVICVHTIFCPFYYDFVYRTNKQKIQIFANLEIRGKNKIFQKINKVNFILENEQSEFCGSEFYHLSTGQEAADNVTFNFIKHPHFLHV